MDSVVISGVMVYFPKPGGRLPALPGNMGTAGES
ncbi:Uncharacterised protein [Salmonella enterica]|uniref:Uncharacterized protein n=1 Tax=Salmonella enterica TaxID=28901 RepID=A0A379QNA4_SALER|nr:Uncharacterised protein [Salmonella enterica]